MSAVDELLRSMERYMAKRKPATGNRAKKNRKSPRVVSAPARHKSLPYNPPRTEPDVTELVESFVAAPTPPEVEGRISPALFVPAVTPPRARPPVDVVFDAPPLRPNVNFSGLTELRGGGGMPIEPVSFSPTASSSTTGATPVRRGSCKAVDRLTGRTCKLPAHAGPNHAHERGAFHLVATVGQVARRSIDECAWNGVADG